MTVINVDRLKAAIEHRHGGTAAYIKSTFVREKLDDATTWIGEVHVFELTGHWGAIRAYAWLSPDGAHHHGEIVTALHTSHVNSPRLAVLSTIAAHRMDEAAPEHHEEPRGEPKGRSPDQR